MNSEETEPVLIIDPRVLAVPIEDCGEPLVDLRGCPMLATTYHPRAKSPAGTRLHCRQDVARRLVVADRSLPEGVRLLVLECHRPIELQSRYWNADLKALRERYSAWSDEELVRENAKFVAPRGSCARERCGGRVEHGLSIQRGRTADENRRSRSPEGGAREPRNTAPGDGGCGFCQLSARMVAFLLWGPLLGLHYGRAGGPLRCRMRVGRGIRRSGAPARLGVFDLSRTATSVPVVRDN